MTKMIREMTNREIRRDLDHGEITKFAKHIPMTLQGCHQRLGNKVDKMNLCYSYAKYRADNPREE